MYYTTIKRWGQVPIGPPSYVDIYGRESWVIDLFLNSVFVYNYHHFVFSILINFYKHMYIFFEKQ